MPPLTVSGDVESEGTPVLGPGRWSSGGKLDICRRWVYNSNLTFLVGLR